MDRKEMEIILKNSYKGKEILKYICQLEEQVSDNKEKFLNLKEKRNIERTLFTFESLFAFYQGEVGCSKEEEKDFITDMRHVEHLIKDYFKLLEQIKNGELSDGYHTFNELYYHRAVLFSVICNQNKELAWKSKQHSDGTMFDNMFIVGIKTPQGQYSYHYDLDLWDMFKVKELECAPEWDGHMPKDIDRLQSIEDNLPLKESDIERDTWIWDNVLEEWIHVFYFNKHTKEIGYEVSSLISQTEDQLYFEENRFYRKRVEE